jgi:probable HAF family extracellular repeat protein
LPVAPYSINASGQIAGWIYIPNEGNFPAVYQNGQSTDLISTLGIVLAKPGGYVDGSATAINAKGDMLITVWQSGAPIQSYYYSASSHAAFIMPTPTGGGSFVAAALNNNDQVVGGGYLYTDPAHSTVTSLGTLTMLTSLLNANSGWTDLNATGINDLGQIVGQGTYNGQQVAFLMTPDAIETPEPAALVTWAALAAAGLAYYAAKRAKPAALPLG